MELLQFLFFLQAKRVYFLFSEPFDLGSFSVKRRVFVCQL